MLNQYEFKFIPGQTMNWKQGQPCSNCNKPTEVELHKFDGGGKHWEYFAPLYHNVEENLGFCCTDCVLAWIDKHVDKKK
jgi:hypothetical protein